MMVKFRYLLGFLSLVWATSFAQIPERPNPPRLVNDFAQIFSTEEANALEYKLRKYNDTTSTQIAVVTVQSLEGYDIAQYAQELGTKWGVGQKSKNNGVVVLVAPFDRKVTIATGYGMEAVLPDAVCKRIIDKIIVPAFKQKAYYQGIDEATSVIIGLASGTYKAKDIGSQGSWVGWFVVILILLFIILPLFQRARNIRQSHYGSRGMDFWTILALLSSSNSGSHRSGNDWGGGFGGFGGGDFGGGGASGSW